MNKLVQTIIYCYLILMLVLSNAALAESTLYPDGKDLASEIEYLEDPTHQLNVSDLQSRTDLTFQKWHKSGDINFGFTQSTYWFRITLANTPNTNPNKRLVIPFITLQNITLFTPDQQVITTGSDYSFSDRAWPHRYFVFPIQLTNEPQTYYLKIRTNTAMTIPLTLWEVDDFAINTQTSYLLLGGYYGGLIALMIYNLLIFISLREPSFLFYVLFNTSMGLCMAFGNGIGQQYLWSYSLGSWESQFTTGLYTLTLTTAMMFTRSFLQTRQQLIKLDTILLTAIIISLFVVIASFITNEEWVTEASALSIMIGTILILIAGFSAYYHGNKSAKFFVIAWTALCTGAFVGGLRSFDLLPTNIFTANAVQITSAFEMLLLSFALAYRIRIEKEAKEQAQSHLLANLKTSEARLEYLVEKRTEELKNSLHNEQTTLEKFIRFGAYISHEFRNPLAIIKNQLTTLQKERSLNIHDHLEKRLTAISTASNRLSTLFENWLHHDRLRQGESILRITTIMSHEFLHKICSLCQDIYSDHNITLTSQNMSAEFFYADEEMIRMAIINLIDNAVKYSPIGTDITVHLLTKDHHIGIMVEDQGKGIDLAQHPNLFQDYFRIDYDQKKTKGVGLGLGFVHKVCELHHGSLTVTSEPNKGSKFYIWLNKE